MAYVDVEDVRQWFRENPAINDINIEEVMGEQEVFVMNYIELSPLPPAHPLLRHIIRDLTIARLMLNIMPAQSGNFDLAVEMNRQAMSKLYQIKQDGLVLMDGTGNSRGNPNDQVWNPREETFWSLEDFITHG